MPILSCYCSIFPFHGRSGRAEINRALKKAEDTVAMLSHNNQFLEQEKKELVSQVQQLQAAIS